MRTEVGVGSFFLGVFFTACLFPSGKGTVVETVNTVDTVFIRETPVDTFSENLLREELVRLNVKFPEIVMAQARLETGNFSSKIFNENHNLFGMKEAYVRISTNEGTQYSHARYEDWRSSVLDYALYQATYLSRVKSQEDYLKYLSDNYAQDPGYVNKIRMMISQ